MEGLNPDFGKFGAQVLKGHFEDLMQTAPNEEANFPIGVFPEKVVRIIQDADHALGYPMDFTAAGMLYATAVAIGNTHIARLKNGYEQTAVLYLAIVGKPGVNKSHPLSFALKPIQRREAENQQRNKEARKEFDRISVLTKAEREEAGLCEVEKPKDEQILLSDFTPEALIHVHSNNPRGIGVYCDELASWFLNFNRYHKGSEEQFWLSAWSGKPIQVNRRTSDNLRVEMPFIPVIGTMQPAIIQKLADNRQDTGFIERILFVYPEDLMKRPWTDNELHHSTHTVWDQIIRNILSFELELDEVEYPKPVEVTFAEDAKARLYQWQREITDLSNDPETESLSAIYAKMEPYAIRFGLILQILKYAAGEAGKTCIELEAVEGAIRLAKYFTANAEKVLSILNNSDPAAKLTEGQQAVFLALPDTFTTNEGAQIAVENGMPKRNFERLLTNRKLFAVVKRGHYQKLM